MAANKKYFDIAIGESDGNGGDIQMLKNDLAMVYNNENQVYLALFGGNVEQNTPSVATITQTNDYWGNSLFWANNTAQQFNSNTERALNTTPLNSAGRIKIENAVKDDLKYLQDAGVQVTVSVTIPGINTVMINIKTVYSEGNGKITVIKFTTAANGNMIDFSFNDFDSNDFY